MIGVARTIRSSGGETAVGALVRAFRSTAGLTQEELAERGGLGVRSIQAIEAGERLPRRDTVRRLADGLGLGATERAELETVARRASPPAPVTIGRRSPQDNPPPRHNLPVQLTSFVGRARELAEVEDLLTATRLLTLTGSGGCGKTRLALRVAADASGRDPDDVRLVELAPLADPSLVTSAVAAVIGAREEPGRPLDQTLAEALQPRHLLLVLDNCEHLLGSVARLADALLRACPRLQILATSREALGIGGEVAYRVPSLALPPPGEVAVVERLAHFEAIQLFCERARAAQPGFALTERNAASVAQLCRRLDGMPLALELAAARVPELGVRDLAERLDQRFLLLTGGSRATLPRQRTLRAIVDWSYELLDEQERRLFARLAVFAGGWALEAGEAVGAAEGIAHDAVADLLGRLVGKSLVQAEEEPDGGARYRLLETLRQYGRERLVASGEEDAAREAHTAYFLALFERARPELYHARQPALLDRLEPEYDNLRAALQWLADRGDDERGRRLVLALGSFWQTRGYLAEGQRWVEAALARSAGVSPALRAELLRMAAQLAFSRGDLEVAATLARERVAIRRGLGDPRALAEALTQLGMIAREGCAYPEALDALDEARRVLREVDDPIIRAENLHQLGTLAWQQSDLARARALLEESLAICRTLDSPGWVGRELLGLGRVAEDAGDYPRAQSLYGESGALLWQIKNRWLLSFLLDATASLSVARGRYRRGAILGAASAAWRQRLGVTLPTSERPRTERTVQLAHVGLGADGFARAWAEGQSLAPDEMIAYALAGDEG